MKHVYNESAKFIGSSVVHFGIIGPWNAIEMVPVIGMEGIVSGVNLHYKQDYLTPDICSLI